MQPRSIRAFAYMLGAIFLYTAFYIGAGQSDAYLMHYGTFLPSRGELAFKLHLLVFVLPAAILMAAAAAELFSRRLLTEFDALGTRRLGRASTLVIAGVVFGLVMLVRVDVLRKAPVTDDENVYHFQAALLASGRLYAESPPEPVRPFFNNQFIINNGHWFGLYFLGHSAVLALALQFGFTEYVGAIFAALTFMLAVGIARRLFGERAAILAGILLALSPFFIFVSATHLSQPTSTFLLTLFIYAALRLEASPITTSWWAVAAIALVGGIFVRPQTGVFLSLPFVVRIGYRLIRGSLKPGRIGLVLSCLILLAGAVGFLSLNYQLTGSPFRTGYQVYMAQGIKWLFPFGPFYTAREISQNLAQLNFWLLGWPVSLIFVPLFERHDRSWALVMVPMIALAWYGLVAVPTVAAVGPVYYAETIVPLVILTASGIERTVGWVRQRLGDDRLTSAFIAAPFAGILSCLVVFMPIEVASLRLMADIARAPYDFVEERGLDHALVFVHSLPARYTAPGAWVYYHRNPSPDLSDRVLFVRDLGGERNKVLMRYLPDRTPYWMGMQDGKLLLLPVEW